jgi:hypothetical protein
MFLANRSYKIKSRESRAKHQLPFIFATGGASRAISHDFLILFRAGMNRILAYWRVLSPYASTILYDEFGNRRSRPPSRGV